jgi:GNAT superfamily N-acetyltransferase
LHVIRRATSADADILARLRYEFRAAAGEASEDEEAFVARCAAWMSGAMAGGGWRCWVVEEGGAIVGMAWLLTIEKLPNPVVESERHGYVSSLYVRPGHRGRALGSGLLEACLQACRDDGHDAVFLWPTPRSRNLYERHGFRVREDLMSWRREKLEVGRQK